MKSRSSINPLVLVPVFLVAALVAYLMLVEPCGAQVQKDRAALQGLRSEVSKRQVAIQTEPTYESRLGAVKQEIASFEPLYLEPLLESYAMRAKSLVGDFAEAAGLKNVEFAERSVLPLPVLPGSPVPSSLHARRSILVTCNGDYAAIVSFILRVEHEFKHVALGGVRVLPMGGAERLLRAEIVLEWPTKGEVRK